MTNHTQLPKRILILGGGFGGIRAALNLAKYKIPHTQITLISNKTYFEYYPALYRIVTGASPIEVCVPLSDILRNNVEVVTDTIEAIDLDHKRVTARDTGLYEYDILIIALGSQTTYFNVPGVEALSLGFKSVHEAVELRNHITMLFKEHAHPDQNELVSHFHVLIVGGGPSGIEVAGDLSAHMRKLALRYKVDPSLVTIDLVEANNRLLPTLPMAVSSRVLTHLRMLGVNIFLNRQMMKEDVEQVYLKDMSMQTKTVIWTAGSRLNNLLSEMASFSFAPNKRIMVTEHLEAQGRSGVYIIGDAAATKYSGLAQTALYDGAYVARDINAVFRKKKRSTYKPQKVAYSIPVSDNWGVLSIGKIHIYGRLAYWIRHLIDFWFFAQILEPKKFFSLFIEGWKYRKIDIVEE